MSKVTAGKPLPTVALRCVDQCNELLHEFTTDVTTEKSNCILPGEKSNPETTKAQRTGVHIHSSFSLPPDTPHSGGVFSINISSLMQPFSKERIGSGLTEVSHSTFSRVSISLIEKSRTGS